MNRPRMLAPSRILRTTPSQAGGGREREGLVEEAGESIRKGSKSFYVASKVFDQTARERAWLLYAWCRRCDDLADDQDHGRPMHGEALGDAKAADRIKAIRVLTRRALEGQPTADPAFDAFGQVAVEAGLTSDMADDVIEGFALDASGWRPRNEGDMMRYCYHVAGEVGVMMARVMGVAADDHETLDRACDLGLAFQLANIARDIVEDDAAGRCYIPQEWLAEADIPPGEHARPEHRFALAAVSARMIRLMEHHEAAARLGAARLPFRRRWAVLAAARIYGGIGRKVRDRGQVAWNRRVRVNGLEKIVHLIGAFFETVRNSPPQLEQMPRWTRGELMVMARMAGPIAGPSMTPLRDEGILEAE